MKIGTWKGNPIEELSKEELLEVIRYISGDLKRMNDERDSLGDSYYELLVEKRFQ